MRSLDKKFYIIGLGSMGQRRIRNLLSFGYNKKQILGFDINEKKVKDVIKKYQVRALNNFDEGFKSFNPNILIISTPPNKHYKYFLFAAKHKIHFFSEISTTSLGYSQLIPLINDSFVAAPSCTFRFFAPVKRIKELIDKGGIGKVLCFNLYLGQYLPDWHWYEDYRNLYFSKKETGGCKEMLLYEIIWLTYVFSTPLLKIEGFRKKLSDLEIDADDYYSTFLSFDNDIVGTLVIDLLNRKAERSLSIIGTGNTLEWNWIENTLTVCGAGKKMRKFKLKKESPHSNYKASESMYVSELKAFINAVDKKGPYLYSFDEDFKYLKLVEKFSNNS